MNENDPFEKKKGFFLSWKKGFSGIKYAPVFFVVFIGGLLVGTSFAYIGLTSGIISTYGVFWSMLYRLFRPNPLRPLFIILGWLAISVTLPYFEERESLRKNNGRVLLWSLPYLIFGVPMWFAMFLVGILFRKIFKNDKIKNSKEKTYVAHSVTDMLILLWFLDIVFL